MFFNLINQIKLNFIKKKKILILKNVNKKNENIIKILIKLNIIKYIIKYKNYNILILKYYKNNKLLFKLKNFYKTSNNKIIKYNNIKNIKNINGILILTTSVGIINNYEAYKKKIGGLVLLQLWN